MQKYLAQKCRQWRFDDETVHEKLLLLSEEVGELIHACRKVSGMNLDTKREITANVGEEMADVMMMALDLSTKLKLDLEKEILAKIKVVDQRRYKRATKSQY